MKRSSADALLFDLGGVVIDIDFERVFARWTQHAGCDVCQVRERFSPDAHYLRPEIGTLSDEAYFASLDSSLGIKITDAQFLDGWNDIFVGEVPGIAPLLARARERFRLYCVSNTNRSHELVWSALFAGVMQQF